MTPGDESLSRKPGDVGEEPSAAFDVGRAVQDVAEPAGSDGDRC